MSNSIDEFVTLLDANGFSFKRNNGKHEIWTDGIENFALPTGNVTSNRMHDYLRSELRKKVKNQGRDFIDWNDLQKGGKMFNTPRIEIEKDVSETGEFKLLDDDALHFCTEALKEKKSQIWMADSLMALGYRSKRGGKITQSEISRFMVANGHRQLERKPKEETEKPTITIDIDPEQFEPAKMAEEAMKVGQEVSGIKDFQPVQQEQFKSELLDDLREILGTSISERLKDKLVRNLLK